jgi:hypothetical protein
MGNYATEFTRLSNYYRMLLQEESDRVRQLVKGLRPELKRALIGMALSTYNAAAEIA